MLSITTDYVTDTGCPEPYLRRIADAGFSHVHWCHHWSSDFIYTDAELDQIGRWLNEFGLAINDIHGSEGKEKFWGSPIEYQRLAGVELVHNRIDMAARFGCDVVIMHFPTEPNGAADRNAFWDRMRRSLDVVTEHCVRSGVRMAIENLPQDDGPTLQRVFNEYGPESVGFCYDPGHGNMAGDGLAWLDRFKDRLIATHLNDNDGKDDLHKLVLTDSVDWDRLATLIAASAYDKPAMTMEVTMDHAGISDEDQFLASARKTGIQFQEMVEAARIVS